MRKIIPFLITSIILGLPLYGEDSDTAGSSTKEITTEAPSLPPFKAFTGKINRNKVRMRLSSNLDSPIIKELNKGDMIVVIGETEDFYAIQPSSDIKGYIYRTLVLDNVVEGNHVNVRLEPNLDAPVIAQLNGGDRVEGKISPQNNKWMQIVPPKTTRFFVSRDFVEKIGDAHLLETITRRRQEATSLLNDTFELAQTELQKPYDEIQFEQVVGGFRKVIDQYNDFPEQVGQAKEYLTAAQEEYLKKKVAYLEAHHQNTSKLKDKLATQQRRLKELETQAKTPNNQPEPIAVTYQEPQQKPMPAKMTVWLPVEENIYTAWCRQRGACTKEQFYAAQRSEGITLRGIVEPYTRAVKNKPGDYVLVNSSHLPIAYLYSTHVNLQEHVGHEVAVLVAPRPNNQFAFPAYYVIEAD